MSSSCFTSLAFIACLFVYAYAHERPEQERDHLSVGIMRKPDDCPRESKDGDHLTVRYNNTLIDQTPILTTRNSRYFCFQVAGYLRREGMSHGEGDESHNMLLQEIFHEEDKNKDGFISHEEFQGIKHHEL
ncbi:hypothetical protein pdam_00021667 [Pocillopora damicornis]|uniref:peptidylprolyl isomerase n=1 Tax=Pocillopora damicornis TaxID=46731 RepID=A0A3M6ULN6_POCDA|nr:hypothetical protein pdam_00021667 [Pocillopora damicornis]